MGWKCTLLMVLCLLVGNVWAQDTESKEDASGSKAKYEMGFHLGNLLPNQIPGVTEIIGLGGVRAGLRFAPMTYAEAGLIMGNGAGAEWKNIHLDARMDVPVENLTGLVYIGLDNTYYKGVGASSQFIFGGHVGGGIQTQVSGQLWCRLDMKFSFSPGTSLYVAGGLAARF